MAKIFQGLKGLSISGLALLMSLFLVTNVALAKSQGGGFSGPGPRLVSVEEAKTLRDDTNVTLQGYIIESLGDERYTFKDATGTIRIELEDDDWGGLKVNPQDKVEIQGEVDKGFGKLEIEVDRIRKVE